MAKTGKMVVVENSNGRMAGVRLRARPNPTSPIVANVPVGISLEHLQTMEDWAEVQYGAISGWLEVAYLKGLPKAAEVTLEDKVAILWRDYLKG
jgi:SH3-like domain-containing protein